MKIILTIIVNMAILFAIAVTCDYNGDSDFVRPPSKSTSPNNISKYISEDIPSLPSDGIVTTVTVWFIGGGADNEDDLIVAVVNNRLRELGLNIEIDPIWSCGFEMNESAQIALDTGDTRIDIYEISSWGLSYFSNARNGKFLRLDDPEYNYLKNYGRGITTSVKSAVLDDFRTNGPFGFGLYGIPVPKGEISLLSTADSGFVISVYSQNKEAAMQLLNALYIDNTLAGILCYRLNGSMLS